MSWPRAIAATLASAACLTGSAQLDETVDQLRDLLPDRDVRIIDSLKGVAGSMVRCLARDENGSIIGGSTGLTVDDELVLLPLAPFVCADTIEITAACCDPRDASGIVAFDAAAGLALIRVPSLESDPWEGGLAALPDAAPGRVPCTLLTPFRVEGGEGAFWSEPDVLHDAPAGRLSRRLKLDLDHAAFGTGGVVLDEQGRPAAMTIDWGGAGRTDAGPIAPFLDAAVGADLPEPFHASELLDRAPSDADRSIILTMQLSGNGRDLPHALGWLQNAVALDEANARAWYELGVQHGRRGDADKAVRCLTRSTELDPHFAESWYSLGIELIRLGNHDEARQPLTKAIELDGEYPEPRAMLGVCLLQAEEHDEAIRWMMSALKLKPESPLFVSNLELALRQAGREDEIHDVWRRHAEALPNNARARQWHLYWLIRAELYRTALTEAELAAERFDDNATIIGYLALAQGVTGFGDAEATARRALELDPDEPTARYVLDQIE